MSLLNTDQTPGSFWITNPDNIFRGNHAAGSDRYGYWFDLQNRPTGPSFVPDVCPINMPLGEFNNNVAHSNVRYGLRIFHGLVPRQISCAPISATNPAITATFQDFVGYKNGRNGAIAEAVGDVRFINFKTADNILAGIEFSLTNQAEDDTAQINGGLVIGHSANADSETLAASPHGIITPRTENFRVKNVKFYNFDRNNMAALGSCSHCFHPAATDSGARTVLFEGLTIDSATVTKYIKYQSPFRAIYLDLDGTLTGLGANTWATADWRHNYQPECVFDQTTLDKYNGVICHNTVQVRRIAYHSYKPQHFEGMEMKILQWDQSILDGFATAADLENYKADETNYSIVGFKPKKSPSNGWAMPYVTNHRYKIHWRNGLDFEQMKCDLSERWNETDHNLHIVHNFTDVRAKVEFKILDPNPDLIADNNTLITNAAALETGDNVVYNETDKRWLEYVINGKNPQKTQILMTGYRCIGSCLNTVTKTPIEDRERLWSVASDWDNETHTGKVPEAGEYAHIQSGWNMVLDIAETPLLDMLEINGRLTFQTGSDHKLKVKHLFVHVGELVIGTEDTPFDSKAEIILSGEQQNQHMVYTNAIEAGNKLIANTGTIRMHGQKRTLMQRLSETAAAGATTIKVVSVPIDWAVGDWLALAPTNSIYESSDYVQIKSIDAINHSIELEQPLQNYHFGQATSTGADYNNVDMRGEVYLLTRNVRIVGEDVDGWGGQFVTSDFKNADELWVVGHTILDNVEIYNCSQRDTYKAALRFEGHANGWSKVTNSAIHHGQGRGLQIYLSENIFLQGNVFFDFSTIGGNIQSSHNITFDSNSIVRVTPRAIISMDGFSDARGGLIICAYNYGDLCRTLKFTNNIVSGTDYAGFGAVSHSCGQYDDTFKNNVAHSINGIGGIFYPDFTKSDHTTCFEGSYFAAYKVQETGAMTFFEGKEVRFSHMTLIDNGFSLNAMLGNEVVGAKIKVDSVKIYGDSIVRDCKVQNQCQTSDTSHRSCNAKRGQMLSYFAVAGKEPFPRSKMSLPLYKIKGDGTWSGDTEFTNLEFRDFKQNTTWCGADQKIFVMNPHGADFNPIQKYTNTKFVNVHDDAFAFLMDPPLGWANLADCGNFPCTGPQQLFMEFHSTTTEGVPTPKITNDFKVMANNEKAAPAFDTSGATGGCEKKSNWNAYYCLTDQMAILLFESLDADKRDRMVSPVIITSESQPLQYGNVLNTFMDHVWDGFYTGQIRLSRFPAIVKANEKYTITYTGTPPEKQRFTLKWNNINGGLKDGVIVRIDYPKAGAYLIKTGSLTGTTVAQNSWDEVKRAPLDIRGSGGPGCGENRFVGVENILEFFLTWNNCEVYIVPRDAIVTKIRLEWTLTEFFADGGTTKFVDRLAASLGIHASTIKMVSLYEGSVLAEFAITTLTETSDPAVLKSIESQLKAKIASNSLNLGAPILDASISDVQVNFGGNNTTSNTTNQTTNTTSGNGTPVVIEKNTTTPEEEQQITVSGGTNMTKITILLASIIGVLILFAAIMFVLYKKFQKPKDQVVKTIPDKSDIEDDVYEQQYHPKAEIGDIFKEKQMNKVNRADDVTVTEGNQEERIANDSRNESAGGEDGSPLTSKHGREEQVSGSPERQYSFKNGKRGSKRHDL